MRVPLSLVMSFFPGVRKTRNANQRRNSLAQWQSSFSGVHGKFGQDDVGAMHDQLWDDRHVEVFPSNAPHVEHEGFESGTCSQGPSWYKGFEQQRKAPEDEEKRYLV